MALRDSNPIPEHMRTPARTLPWSVVQIHNYDHMTRVDTTYAESQAVAENIAKLIRTTASIMEAAGQLGMRETSFGNFLGFEVKAMRNPQAVDACTQDSNNYN